MSRMHLDYETRSELDLAKVGVYRYATHPSTKVLCAAYRFDDEPTQWWCDALGISMPERVVRHIESGGVIVAHNGPFEYHITKYTLGLNVTFEQIDCTMARCLAVALPASLDDASKAMALPVNKDAEGRKVMLKMCKPLRWENGAPVWHDETQSYEILVRYCVKDVDVEHAIDNVAPPLSAAERKVWLLDQRINAIGIPVDVPLIERARLVAEIEVAEACKQLSALTGGAVTKPTQHKRMADWLTAQGLDTSNGVGKTVAKELRKEAEAKGLDDALAAMQTRSDAAKSSVAKFEAILNAVGPDSRVRGVFGYHGATTGRWIGRIIQPHNLPRVDPDHELPVVEDVIETVLNESAEDAHNIINLCHGKPLFWLSKSIRGTIRARPGNKIVFGDFSNIEGRVNAWIAGETWKVKAFEDYDNGTGHDLYKLAYAKAFNVEVESVDKSLRQRGKVMELSMGYQGGVGAFQNMAGNYGLYVDDEEADRLKVAWRAAHPNIVQSWWDLQDAAVEAVAAPGAVVPVLDGRVKYLCKGGFLLCLLPSGRALAYARPELVWVTKEYTDRFGDVYEKTRRQVKYWAVDSLSKKWSEQHLYGGLQCENIVQAVARDILAAAMFRLEAAGYPIVMHVHDEAVSEVPIGFGSPEHFAEVMKQVPSFAKGMPIAVSAEESERYSK